MIEDSAKKFDFFGARPVIRAIINNEHRFALIICQAINNAMKANAYKQQKSPPIVGACFEQVVRRVFSNIGIFVDD